MLASHDVGVEDAVMVMPPFGVSAKGALTPISVQEIIDFYNDLSLAVDIPILVYNSTTLAPHLPTSALAKIFENDNIVGMEETSVDYQIIVRDCTTLADKVSILVKSYVLVPAHEAGAHGAIMPVGFSKIGAETYNAFRRGDRKRALELQNILCSIPPEELSRTPAISFYKEAIKQIGLNVGLPRRPAIFLCEEEKVQISRILKEFGLDKLKISA